MITKLALQEIPTNDCKFMRIADNSYYNPNVVVENPILEVTVPGFDCSAVITSGLSPGFSLLLNSSTLKIAGASVAGQLLTLPDGPYYMRFSIKPNDKLFVSYTLFRNCQLTQRHLKAVCNLFSEQCQISRMDFESTRKKLTWIKELMDASKAMAEECGEADKAIEMYNEANRLLTGINDCGC